MLDSSHQLPPVCLAQLPFSLWGKIWFCSWLFGWPRTVLILLLLMIWKSSRRGDRVNWRLYGFSQSSRGERSAAAASKDCGLGQLQQPLLCTLICSLVKKQKSPLLISPPKHEKPMRWSLYRRKRLEDSEGKASLWFWSWFSGQNWVTWQRGTEPVW